MRPSGSTVKTIIWFAIIILRRALALCSFCAKNGEINPACG
jgi:hypothetical protein